MHQNVAKLLRTGLRLMGFAGFMLGSAYVAQIAMLESSPATKTQRVYSGIVAAASWVASAAMFYLGEAANNYLKDPY